MRDKRDTGQPADSGPSADSEKERRGERAARLLEILRLETIEQNLYRGHNEERGQFRLFGGQVLAQALRAACHTVEARMPHSLHAYFMRAGDASRPVLYEVDRIRDGRSFTTRRVVAIQDGEAIFSMSASFQVQEEGLTHAASMPNVPLPDELEDDIDVFVREGAQPGASPMAGRARPFETRSVFAPGSAVAADSRSWNPVWIRFCQPLPEQDVSLPWCLLAYASDMGLVSTALLPFGDELKRDSIQMASLDHSLWIHRPPTTGEWLLLHKRTTSVAGARGMVHAEFYSQTGQLIASVSQEGLLREIRAAGDQSK
ncbi:MAG: acyl-CoA thioesterase II [Pseudomonadales bacterium]|nr:acyl-CoA thioesterase II [Pseudomonadales bacterium]